MKQTNYGNWVPGTLMNLLWGGTALFLAAVLFIRFLGGSGLIQGIFLALFALFAAMALYMQACRRAFSFTGGNVMGNIHRFLLSRLPWDGRGSLLDIGCGSGALAILCAKTWPSSQVTGIDYWGKEWNYAKAQCEENARIEQVPAVQFCQGDAAHLPFADGSFDAAVSNFVFHEVRTQPDKRQVVREALRVIKKGGSFAFHDLFEQKQLYGDMDEFLELLRREGIREIHYEAHTERLPMVPWFAKAPWMLTGLGLIYGRK